MRCQRLDMNKPYPDLKKKKKKGWGENILLKLQARIFDVSH